MPPLSQTDLSWRVQLAGAAPPCRTSSTPPHSCLLLLLCFLPAAAAAAAVFPGRLLFSGVRGGGCPPAAPGCSPPGQSALTAHGCPPPEAITSFRLHSTASQWLLHWTSYTSTILINFQQCLLSEAQANASTTTSTRAKLLTAHVPLEDLAGSCAQCTAASHAGQPFLNPPVADSSTS
jgi:hypothetical protein